MPSHPIPVHSISLHQHTQNPLTDKPPVLRQGGQQREFAEICFVMFRIGGVWLDAWVKALRERGWKRGLKGVLWGFRLCTVL